MTGLKSRGTRVLLISSETDPSTRLRILQYVPTLAVEGFSFETVFITPGNREKEPTAEKLARSDVIFVQRFLSRDLLRTLRRSGKPVVFDFDDALHYIRPPQYFRTIT